MRSCLIATALARRLGVPESEVSDTYYTALLTHVGCSALSHETVAAWGHDQRVLRVAARTNVADPGDIAGTLMPAITEGMGPEQRARVERYAASPRDRSSATIRHRQLRGGERDREACRARARRRASAQGSGRVVERPGSADGLQGEEIALPGRIARAAADAARFDDLGGTEAVVAALRPARAASSTLRSSRSSRRTRRSCSPRPVRGSPRAAARGRARAGPRGRRGRSEPHSGGVWRPGRLEDALDPRPFRRRGQAGRRRSEEPAPGRSERGRPRAVRFARRPGPDRRLERDLGEARSVHRRRVGAGTDAPYHSERILATSDALAPLARVAGMHHERLTGRVLPRLQRP